MRHLGSTSANDLQRKWVLLVGLTVLATGCANATVPDPTVPDTPSSTSSYATTTPSSSTTSPAPGVTSSTPSRRIDHPSGFSMDVPEGWEAVEVALATEFALAGECAAAKVVDFEPPTDSGEAEAGFVLESLVQICAQPAGDQTLGEFIVDVYGSTTGFAPVEIGGLAGYLLAEGSETLAFLQRGLHRYQVVTSVVAEADLEGRRQEEVQRVLSSVTFE